MSGKINVVKGRIREAFGTLTGNKELQTKGKAQQAVGKVETQAQVGVDKARTSAKESIEKAKDFAGETVEKAKKDEIPKKE